MPILSWRRRFFGTHRWLSVLLSHFTANQVFPVFVSTSPRYPVFFAQRSLPMMIAANAPHTGLQRQDCPYHPLQSHRPPHFPLLLPLLRLRHRRQRQSLRQQSYLQLRQQRTPPKRLPRPKPEDSPPAAEPPPAADPEPANTVDRHCHCGSIPMP